MRNACQVSISVNPRRMQFPLESRKFNEVFVSTNERVQFVASSGRVREQKVKSRCDAENENCQDAKLKFKAEIRPRRETVAIRISTETIAM